jgi:AraC-like DNA-binding protein
MFGVRHTDKFVKPRGVSRVTSGAYKEDIMNSNLGHFPVDQLKIRRDNADFEDDRIDWHAFERHVALKRLLSDWLKNHRAISVAEAASLAAMTPAYFSRFFHDKVGVTFKHWIDFMRVNRAVSLLHSANRTVVELVDECGFQDPTTFTRTFRRILGVTPLEYKRRRRLKRSKLAAPSIM